VAEKLAANRAFGRITARSPSPDLHLRVGSKQPREQETEIQPDPAPTADDFKLSVRKVMSELDGASLGPCRIPRVAKLLGMVAADCGVIGDAKCIRFLSA
jgi:hypothetical protein